MILYFPQGPELGCILVQAMYFSTAALARWENYICKFILIKIHIVRLFSLYNGRNQGKAYLSLYFSFPNQ